MVKIALQLCNMHKQTKITRISTYATSRVVTVVVSKASWTTELEGLGSSAISHSGFFQILRSASILSEFAIGSMGRLGPLSRFVHFTDVPVSVLLLT